MKERILVPGTGVIGTAGYDAADRLRSDGTSTTYDWDVSPSYSGTYFTDSASADAAEPAPPPPVTPVVPTWRNLYDWPNGHGYAGWHSASSGQAGAYGMQTALGGQYGLWLWPTGGGSYSYTGGNYAEWTYAAPGTTRLSNATLQFTYRNKLLAHHCIDIGFRTAAGTVVTHNEHCKPVSPPDSQRQVTVSLVDPSANPTSKLLYFRIRVDCGGATSCSKNIPQLDPLATGGYARMLEADMTLVDDDAPAIAATGPFRDLDGTYVNGQGAYDLTPTGQDAGSGILQVWADQLGAGRLVTASAPCDPTHMTPALDNRICPPSYAVTTAIDTRPFPEGTNRFTAGASDLAANVGATPSWSVIVDRSAPTGVSGIALADFDGTQGTGEIDWQPLPNLAMELMVPPLIGLVGLAAAGRIFYVIAIALILTGVQAVQIAKYAGSAQCLLSWNARHFQGKLVIPVLTPQEWLNQQTGTTGT